MSKFWGVMYNLVTIVYSTVYLKVAKSVHL